MAVWDRLFKSRKKQIRRRRNYKASNSGNLLNDILPEGSKLRNKYPEGFDQQFRKILTKTFLIENCLGQNIFWSNFF